MKKSNSTSYLNRPFYKVPEAQNDSKPVIVEETNGTNGINGVNDVKVKDSPKIAIQTDDDDGPKYHSIHTENTISSFIHATKNVSFLFFSFLFFSFFPKKKLNLYFKKKGSRFCGV